MAVTALSSAALLLLVLILGSPCKTTGQVTVQVRGIHPASTNVVQVTVTLSNAASRSLNIVDAVDGHPWYHIAPHPELHLKYGSTLARMANTLKINLAPRATLTDSFWITNPPPRFRITVPVRDLDAEARQVSTVRSNLLGKSLTKSLQDLDVINPPDPEFHSIVPAAHSTWVDAKLP